MCAVYQNQKIVFLSFVNGILQVMIKVISQPITQSTLQKEAQEVLGELVKAVVDIEQEIMAISGELHADEEAVLIGQGSKQKNLWGINLYPDLFGQEDWLEFDSMINLRPSGGNNTRGVEDEKIRTKIRHIVSKLVTKK